MMAAAWKKVLTDVTSSSNYGALEMQVAMDFYIGIDQDATLAAELIREACLTSPFVYLEQPIPALIKQLIVQDYVVIHLKARPYVFDCKHEKPKSPLKLTSISAFSTHSADTAFCPQPYYTGSFDPQMRPEKSTTDRHKQSHEIEIATWRTVCYNSICHQTVSGSRHGTRFYPCGKPE